MQYQRDSETLKHNFLSVNFSEKKNATFGKFVEWQKKNKSAAK